MPKYKVGDMDIRYGKEGAEEAMLLVAGSTVELEEEDGAIIGAGITLIIEQPAVSKELTNKELIAKLQEFGVEIPKNPTKPVLIELLDKAEKAKAEEDK